MVGKRSSASVETGVVRDSGKEDGGKGGSESVCVWCERKELKGHFV